MAIYDISHPTLEDNEDGTYAISRMQPLGDAASELASLLECTHQIALGMLQAADADMLYTGPAVTIMRGQGDIAYTVILT